MMTKAEKNWLHRRQLESEKAVAAIFKMYREIVFDNYLTFICFMQLFVVELRYHIHKRKESSFSSGICKIDIAEKTGCIADNWNKKRRWLPFLKYIDCV